MITIFYKSIFLFFLFIFLSLVIYKILKSKEIKKTNLIKLLLILLGFLIAFYIRFIVYKDVVFASSDESNYISLLYLIKNGEFAVVSGPGYIFLIQILNYISNIEFINLVPLSAFFVTTIYLFVVYILYKTEIKNTKYVLLSCMLLLSTSYFLWPIIEARPQQIGMILFFISSLFFYKYLQKEKYFLPFIITYFLTFIFHILSFFVLSGSVFLISYWRYLKKQDNFKRLFYLIIIFSLCMFLFTRNWFIYSTMSRGVLALLVNFPLCLLNKLQITIFAFIFVICAVILLTYFLRKSNFTNHIDNFIKKPISLFLLFLLIILSLFIQYRLGSDLYSSLYLNSLPYFIFFQLGNIFFGIMYLLGLSFLIKENKTNNIFFTNSFALMVLGALIIIPSLAFPSGFANGLIRIINYWTLFAAPIALIPLIKIKQKLIISILISIFIIISLINTSQDPYFFNNELYWDDSDISSMKWLCKEKGTFLINHSKNDFLKLSKEFSYKRLLNIIKNKNNLDCKNKTITILNEKNLTILKRDRENFPQRPNNHSLYYYYYLKNKTNLTLAYENKYIKIYKLEKSNIGNETFIKDLGWNDFCPKK